MKHTPDITRTLILAALMLGMLSLVMPKNKEKYLADMFWARKTFAPAKYQVVLLGDSRVYRGISPEVMEEQLPEMEVLNFGYSNGGLNPMMLKAAEEKLAAKGQRVLVLGISANTVTAYTQNNEQYLQEVNRPREEVLERLYLNPILYWFSATSPEALKAAWKAEKATTYYRSDYHMNGYVESDKFPADTTEALPLYEKDFRNFQVNDQLLEALYQQVKAWTEDGIWVLAFRPPLTSGMRQLEENMGLYNEAAIKAGIESAGGRWVNVPWYNYSTYDGSHLDKPSAERFSLFLADEINRLMQAKTGS
ncbi:MAG: hypothetical protein JXR22_02295 [Prolixibacteraceae bacterium]|nr:hypothetical protein [Prolixibacteraceae bacterium]